VALAHVKARNRPGGAGSLTMPRYHFNLEGAQPYRDAEGVELPDLDAACAEAVRFAGELLADEARRCEDPELTVLVTEGGRTVYAVRVMATEPAPD
jgi:hypothetical protein